MAASRLRLSTIRPGERLAVAVLLVDLLLILTAYYLLKVVREPLILVGGGAEVKSYAAAGQALLLVGIVPAYGWLASRVSRLRLHTIVTVVFIGCLIAFHALATSGVSVGVVFYLWLGIFSLFVIAQFWSLATDLFTPAQGKRLFPFIAFGGTAGAVLGAWIAGLALRALPPVDLMWLAAGVLGLVALLTRLGARVASRARASDAADAPAAPDDAVVDGPGGFALVRRDRYLRAIAALMVVYNMVNSIGEFLLGKTVVGEATARAAAALPGATAAALAEHARHTVAAFYGDYFTWINVLTVALQLVVVPTLLRRAGVRLAILVLPVVALGSAGLYALLPALWMIKGAKIAENSVDYSLQSTARQALWLPTSRAAKYKAKAAIDTFFVRLGDMSAAGVVALGSAVALGTRGFALVNGALVVVWLGLTVVIGRRHAALEARARLGRV
jgi:AAA family ATP:ADP antiporter